MPFSNPNAPRRTRALARASAALLAAAGASAALLAGGAAPLRAASPLTLRTIAIDGSFSDWDAVLVNPLQTTHDGDGSSPAIRADCGAYSSDRDCPLTGGAGNDFFTFAWTYDASNVYLYVERYGSSTNPVDLLFVADVNRDLRLTTGTDVVVRARWFGTSGAVTFDLWDYIPAAGAAGDPIVCTPVAPATACANGAGLLTAPAGYVDGYKLPGSNVLRADPSCPSCLGKGGPSGRRAELKVPWSAFGVTVDQPFYWHVVSSNNESLTSAVDNIGAPDGRLGSFNQRGVSLYPDGAGSVPSPGEVTYVHTLRNDGNAGDLFDLVATSSQGAQVELVSAGTVIAVDLTGDGAWDTVLTGHDANADGRPDVSLAADAAQELSLRITLPSGRSGVDVTRLRATSAGDPRVSADVADTSQIGQVAFIPAQQTGATVAAQALPFRETLRNGQTVPETFRLAAAAGCGGFRLELAEDASGAPGAVVAVDATGDGTWDTVMPAGDSDGDGAPDLGEIAAGATKAFHLVVTPPAGAAAGTACTVTLSATGTATGASANAEHGVTVAEKVTVGPSYLGAQAGARDAADAQMATGASVFLPATLVNAESSARAYDLAVSLAGPAGGSARVWSDPDGDGNPSDGAVVTTTDPVAPWGGVAHLVVELRGGTAVPPAFFVATVTARALVGGAEATQISEVVLGYLAVYADDLHTASVRPFAPCSTVHVVARGLAAGDVTRYALEWRPPSGAPPAGVSPWATTAIGTADAALALAADAAPGAWTARLLESGATKDEVGFSVELAGTLASLTTDRLRYRPGDAVNVTAEVSNGGASALLGTALLYSGATTRANPGVDVSPGETLADAFTFTLPGDVAPGAHAITAGWRLSCGATPFATRTATIEVVPPPPAIAAPAEGAWLGDATPTVEGTALAGGSVIVTITDPLGPRISAPVPVDAEGRFAWTVPDADALSEGPHTASATQSAGGVESDASAPVAFGIDTTPPAAPSIGSPSSGTATSAPSVAVSGAAVDPEAASVEVLVDGAVVATAPVVSGGFDAILTLAEGAFTITARALDAAGNASASSTPVSLVVDRTAPATPAWSAPSPTALALVPVSGTTEPNAAAEILDGGVRIATTTADGAGAFSAEVALSEGTHALSVRVIDAAGNATVGEPADVVVDRTDPPVPVVGAPADGAILGVEDLVAGQVPFSGTAEPGALVEIEIDGVSAGTAVADAEGAWAIAAVVPAGDHVLRVRATDAAGNASDLGVASGFTLDAVLPGAPVLASPLPGGALSTSEASLPVSGAAEPGATVRFLLDGVVVATAVADGAGAFSADVPLPVADGSTVLTVVAVDAAGNASAASAGVTVEVDRTAPAAPTLDAPADGAVLPPGEVEVRGHAEPGATVTVTAAGNTVTIAAAPGDGGWSVALTLPEGTHAVTATAQDGAGNASAPASATVIVRADADAGGGGDGGGGCGCRTGAGGGAPALLGLLALLALAPRGRRRAA